MKTVLKEQILRCLLPYTNFLAQTSDLDELLHPMHGERIQAAIDQREPVVFALPAFPAKSPNPEKTMGELPDLGELLALYQLNQLCLKIRAIYSPGARVIICSDGRVFSDLVGVDDTQITRYTRAIENMIKDHALSCLSTFHLEDTADLDFSDLRASLVEKFGQDLISIRAAICEIPAQRQLFNGMHRFLFEDGLALNPEGLSRNQIRERTKTQTYELIRRSDAWSRVVEENFPFAVRLSIHPQLPQSRKIGVQLVPSDDPWRTPWHSVAVVTDQGIRLMKRSEAVALGAIAKDVDSQVPGWQRFELAPLQEVSTRSRQFLGRVLLGSEIARKELVYA